jgi:hypothetical protein
MLFRAKIFSKKSIGKHIILNNPLRKVLMRKHLPVFIGLCSLLMFSSCAPGLRRIGYRGGAQPSSPDCQITIFKYNVSLDPVKKLGTLVLYDNGFSINCGEDRMMELVRQEGCALGATTANLYNIKEPSFFGSSCFQAYADFYSDSIPAPAGKKAVAVPSFVDSIRNKGLEVQFCMTVAFLTGGPQNDPGLNPAPDNVSKILTGIVAEYMFDNLFGIELNYDFYGDTHANASGYKPLSLYNDQVLRLGMVVDPLVKVNPHSLLKWEIKGGINYDFMKLHDDYKNLILQYAPPGFYFLPGYATGIGMYFKTDIEFVLASRLMFSGGFGYENINPKFNGAAKSIDGSMIPIFFGLGYKFR